MRMGRFDYPNWLVSYGLNSDLFSGLDYFESESCWTSKMNKLDWIVISIENYNLN